MQATGVPFSQTYFTSCLIFLSNVAGKRSCLGRELARQEIFLFIVSLLQNFYFKPPEGQDSLDVHEEWSVVNAPSAHEIRMIPRL